MIGELDVTLSRQLVDLRCGALTPPMLLLSAWWVKDLVLVAAAGVRDLRRRAPPWTALLVALATLLGARAADLLKPAFDRSRPFTDGLWPRLGPLPGGSSMPSGHASTAFAGAVAAAILWPAARVPALALATLVALSRVYLGDHFLGDVLAGGALGAALGAAVALAVARR